MNRTLALAVLSVTVFARPVSHAFAGNPAPKTPNVSVEDFDWREMVPYLFAAATLPEDEGVKQMLENARLLRVYIASDVRAECKPGNERCDSSGSGFTPDGEVTRRIDDIVKEGLIHRHKTASIDYAFDRRAFPFSQISALRSEKREDAYVVVQFADHAYNVSQVQAKYGAPYDTDIFDRYSVFKYRLDNAKYRSKAFFEVDPTNGSVLQVAISLKARAAR
jgi:hypothetical protein